MTLTPDEQFLLDQHRDMASNGRYGDLVIKYEAGIIQRAIKQESVQPPSNKGNQRRWAG